MKAERFDEDWRRLVESSEHDARHNLVAAAFGSTLRRFFPFTSLNRLCFATSAYPFEVIKGAFVIIDPDGFYVACSGSPYNSEQQRALVETYAPEEAIRVISALLDQRVQ